MLSTVASFITVALLYFQLTREDYKWWWASFFNGGATGFFIATYSIFYYFYRSNMDGVLQTSFYFGYMGIMSYAFVLMLGFIGFLSSFEFMTYVYSNVKSD
jgi:transmembrane 9 superfamily protein 1